MPRRPARSYANRQVGPLNPNEASFLLQYRYRGKPRSVLVFARGPKSQQKRNDRKEEEKRPKAILGQTELGANHWYEFHVRVSLGLTRRSANSTRPSA